MNPIVVAMGVMLVASVAGNLFLIDAVADATDRAITAEQQRTTAMAAANACGDAVRELQAAAERQRSEAQAAIEAAQKFAGQQRKAAAAERARAQAVPGNACASAEVETREWMQRRQGAAN